MEAADGLSLQVGSLSNTQADEAAETHKGASVADSTASTHEQP